MSRVKIILEHLINIAQIEQNEDLEIALRTTLGALERDCLNEFSDICLDFTQKKVVERMMNEN